MYLYIYLWMSNMANDAMRRSTLSHGSLKIGFFEFVTKIITISVTKPVTKCPNMSIPAFMF